MSNPEKKDIYTHVTNKIIADLEAGNLTWLQPWQASHAAGAISRPLRGDGKPYHGINVLMLWIEAMEKGYSAPIWMTYKQAQALGGQVKKGEKGSLVVYANTFTAHETSETGEDIEKKVPFLKTYTVFNVEQIDGLTGHFYATAQPQNNDMAHMEAVERFFANTGATIRHGGNQAYYSPSLDAIQMPKFETFKDPESYYATLGHETVHWTRHPSRLNRDFGRQKWGDEGYAMEELVAELGAAYLCADLRITPETRPDHAAYIAAWLKVLKQDKRAIFTAAAHAERATDHLQSYQGQTPDPEQPQAQDEEPQAKVEAEAINKLSEEADLPAYVQGRLF